MVKVITDRKNELLELENKKNEEVTDELEYLLSLSKDLEEDDQLHAVMTLAEREQAIVQKSRMVQSNRIEDNDDVKLLKGVVGNKDTVASEMANDDSSDMNILKYILSFIGIMIAVICSQPY